MATRIVEQFHVNDTPKLILTMKDPNVIPQTAHDISAMTTKTLKVMKPDGTQASFTASFTTDGTDGKIEYQFAKTELDQAGWWDVYGFVSNATLNFRSNSIRFEVFPE